MDIYYRVSQCETLEYYGDNSKNHVSQITIMPPVYPFAIQSIPDKHPGLPHTISGINIHHPIEQGQPLNPDDLNDAKIKAGFLKGYHSE